MMKELYKYREFIKTSVMKEFRGKYKKSFLGVLWSFINPLLQLLVYSLVFSFIMKVDVPHFTVFLVVALIPWNFFNTTIVQSTSTVICNGGILKKVYFPREILPISIVTSNMLNFFVSLIIILGALFISGIGININILFIFGIMIIQYMLTLGFAFILSAITVYIRDLEYFISVLMMLWFYLCPIVYGMNMIPDNLLKYFRFNPMLHIINAYRDILYYKTAPQIDTLLILFLICSIFCFAGYKIFKKLEKRFVEEL